MTINALYEVSRTPKPIGLTQYFKNSEVIQLVNFLLKSDARAVQFAHLKNDEIKEIVGFILDVVDTPESLEGLLLIEPSVTYMLDSACTESKLDRKTIEVFHDIEKEWFMMLGRSPHVNKYLSRPDITESALFRYHLDSFASSKVDDQSLPPLYKAYGYFIHKTIRFKMDLPIDINTKESYARRGRQFFKYLPIEYKAMREHPKEISPEYIKAFASGYDVEESLKSDDDDSLSETAEELREDFNRLINFSVVKPNPHSGHKGSGRPKKKRRERDILRNKPVNGNATILENDGHLPEINAVYLNPETETYTDEEEKLAGSFEANQEIPVYEVPKGDISKKPSLRKRWADLINLLSFRFYWDIKYLNLFHYSILHMRLNTLWNSSSFNNAVIVYLYILMHTGIDFKMLLYLSKWSKKGLPRLCEANGRYYILMPQFIKSPSIKAKQCLPTSDRIWVPLPELINALMTSLQGQGGEYVFSYKGENGEVSRLGLADVISFLDEKVNDVYHRYDIKITLAKICMSFFPIYQHHFGLDPLICILISGEDHHKLYKSQLHYAHIGHAIMEREYLDAFKRVTAAIKKNMEELAAEGFIEGPEESALPQSLFPLEVIHRTNDGHGGSADFAFGYGSPIICDEEYVLQQITALKDATISEKDPMVRHNYFTVYAYLCTQFSTALRPRNNPEILFNPDSRAIVIQDKQSANYHEERILPPANILSHLLKELRHGIPVIQRHIAKYHYPAILGQSLESLFFFVDPETGRIREFTLKGMKGILGDIGIDFELPMNFPRHYIKNYLYHGDICNDVIDMWMGHQHSGREMLSIISSTMPGSAAVACIDRTESMLQKIGFSEINYMRGK